MKIHPEFITEADEGVLVSEIEIALGKMSRRTHGNRSRILRYGLDYETGTKQLAEIPKWIPDPGFDVGGISVNEYIRGQVIGPHIDSPKFGDVAILSLLADATMRFTSGMGEQKDFFLPRRSLAGMSGELRHKWKHESLPLDADLRYSVVYRKRL